MEWADATDLERSEPICNAGVVCASSADMARWLGSVGNDNAKGEYYLTDIVNMATDEGRRVTALIGSEDELRGINTPEELAAAEAVLRARQESMAVSTLGRAIRLG